jgi:hypothetical protein
LKTPWRIGNQINAIQTDRTPNLHFMHDSREPGKQRMEAILAASFPAFASAGFERAGDFSE